MRWVYPDNRDAYENAARDGVRLAIKRWWEQFHRHHHEITASFNRDYSGSFDLPNWMARNLQSIHESIMWEYGPAVRADAEHRLVLTPEFVHDLEPLVREIVTSAPRIAGWEFYLYRLFEGVEEAEVLVNGRVGGTLREGKARVSRGEANLIDVAFHLPSTGGDLEDRRAAASIAAECLLGEEDYHHWTGVIDYHDAVEGRGWLPLDRLRPTFEALKQSIRDQLASGPVKPGSRDATWTMFNREYEEANDYGRVDDLYIFSLSDGTAAPALLGGWPLISERFSRSGELFTMLKMDFSAVAHEKSLETRNAIEDDIESALQRVGGGAIWGNGTGARYSYIFLAVLDVSRAVAAIREVCAKHKVSRRSWIQFLDARLANEWFGVYPDSPPPPGHDKR